MGIGCVVVALGCGSRKPQPPPGVDEVQLAGWRAYVDLNCAGCHGENREGKRSGPPLTGLAERWSAEQLVSYLEDPDAMLEVNPRLAYRAEQYAIGMPKVSGKSPGYGDRTNTETLEALTEYLLVDIRQAIRTADRRSTDSENGRRGCDWCDRRSGRTIPAVLITIREEGP